MITADAIIERLPAIRNWLQPDFSANRSMMRGELEALELQLSAGGWEKIDIGDPVISVWAHPAACEPILVVVCRRDTGVDPYTAHPVDLRDLNIQGIHAA